MQNLPKYSNRQFVLSRNIVNSLFKYHWKRDATVVIEAKNGHFNNELNRLYFLLSQRLFARMQNESTVIRSLLLRNSLCTTYCLTGLHSTRNFSTTSRLLNKNEDPKSSEGPSNKNPKKENEMFTIAILKILVTALISFLILVNIAGFGGAGIINPQVVDEFLKEMLVKGEIKEIKVNENVLEIILHNGAIYKGKVLPHIRYIVRDSTQTENIENKIRTLERQIGIKAEDAIPITFKSEGLLSHLTMLAIMLAVAYYVVQGIRRTKFPNPFDIINQQTRAKYTLVEPYSGKGVRFEDVAGLKEAKVEVMEFVDYLKNPERYQKLGAKIPKGALLLGPPGCGKTLLAKAVATESNVPFLSMNGSEFIEMLGGLGAARVRNLFADAKKRAPSIIYIDEIDAIGRKRSHQDSDNEAERTLNQLLTEMDGMTTAQNVIILASTNRADVLDTALLRRGRFDRHISIDLPTLQERKQIFEYHLKSLSLEGEPAKYSGYLAYLTPGFSGADIANVCNEAALHAAREKQTSVGGNDLLYAIDRTIGGTVKKSRTLTPTTKKVVAYHEAGHALVGWLLEHTDALLKVTIVPRTNMSLGFAQYVPPDQKLFTQEELFQKICMMLGGRVAESLTFNKISTGAENDLGKVTKLAYSQVQQYGMSPSVGLISFDEEITSSKTKKFYSNRLANIMDVEVRRIISEAYKATEKLLLDNKDKLEKLAEALLKKETLNYDEVEKLIGPPTFGKKRLIEPVEFVTDFETQTPAPTPS